MGNIIYPFGEATVLDKPTAKQASASYELSNMLNFLSIPTIDNRKVKLTITFDDHLPVGAVLNLRTQIAKGTGIYFTTGGLTTKAKTAGFIIGDADGKATGHWVVRMEYDGTGLLPVGFINLNANKLNKRG